MFNSTEAALVEEATKAADKGAGRGRGRDGAKAKVKLTAENWWMHKKSKKKEDKDEKK